MLAEIDDYLKSMESPFQFFKDTHGTGADGELLTADEVEDLRQERDGDTQYH